MRRGHIEPSSSVPRYFDVGHDQVESCSISNDFPALHALGKTLAGIPCRSSDANKAMALIVSRTELWPGESASFGTGPCVFILVATAQAIKRYRRYRHPKTG